jgi:hypothetical protein
VSTLAGGDYGYGRGWFRTSDLSRVKRRLLRGLQVAEIRIAQFATLRAGHPRRTDYQGLRTIIGDSGRKATFCPLRPGRIWTVTVAACGLRADRDRRDRLHAMER